MTENWRSLICLWNHSESCNVIINGKQLGYSNFRIRSDPNLLFSLSSFQMENAQIKPERDHR
jgi:hypothetical protein